MLEEIRIRDLGVIEEAHLDLGPGLTVLTGETGAGKTMVLTALGLVLGGKAEAALVRTGEERAVCAARFRATPELEVRVESEFGADVGEGLVFARMISAEGRTRSLLSGASVPAGTLAALGEELVSIHGQGSASKLLRPTAQRALLDQYAGGAVLELRERHQVLHAEVRDLDAKISALTNDRRGVDAEIAELRALIAAVERHRPEPGELDALRTEIERLAHADALITAVTAAREALVGAESDAPSVSSLLHLARRSLEQQSDVDTELHSFATEVMNLAVRSEELGADLLRHLEQIDLDPRRLEAAQSRRADLQALVRRFAGEGEGLDGLLQRYDSAGLRLMDLDGGQARVEQLSEQRREVEQQRYSVAELLTDARIVAAERLEREVTAEIHALAMPHSTFTVRIAKGEVGAHGHDDVEFLLAGAGATPVPIAKGASGGELSRVMLALEVIVAATQPVATYIFDEVDAGVGGAAAIEVGRRLQRLAKHSQVVVVTHLAQVAAFADAHYSVVKNSDGQVTSSTVQALDRSQRASELARMMAGLADSEGVQAGAAELLAMADSGRIS